MNNLKFLNKFCTESHHFNLNDEILFILQNGKKKDLMYLFSTFDLPKDLIYQYYKFDNDHINVYVLKYQSVKLTNDTLIYLYNNAKWYNIIMYTKEILLNRKNNIPELVHAKLQQII